MQPRWCDGGSDGSTTRRARRRVVEQQQHVCEQPVASAEVDDAAAAAHPPHPPRQLPGFVQLLARQAPGGADRAGDPIEQRLAGEPAEIVRREAAGGPVREHRPRSYPVAGAASARGSAKPTVTLDGSLDAQTVPPCASTSCLTIVRPRPAARVAAAGRIDAIEPIQESRHVGFAQRAAGVADLDDEVRSPAAAAAMAMRPSGGVGWRFLAEQVDDDRRSRLEARRPAPAPRSVTRGRRRRGRRRLRRG